MNRIAVKHALQKGDFRLQVDTHIPASGITGVFGESGSGKTTLLRAMAGLESHNDGIAVHQRRVGLVFQEPRLFPHMSVRKNIEYGMRRNAEASTSVDEVARFLEIDSLLARHPHSLSGGEAQRVSIARVLCQSPRLILMDEPLSALDERRRGELLPYLDRLHRESTVPIVYVSHNIDEICRLSDHLLVLDNGRVIAEGELLQMASRIDLPQLSGRNAGAAIEATQRSYDERFDLTLFRFSGGDLWVPGRHTAAKARLRIRASDISLSLAPAKSSTVLNSLPAVVAATANESRATALLRIAVGDDLLVARITRRSLEQLDLKVGDSVFAQIKAVTVRQ